MSSKKRQIEAEVAEALGYAGEWLQKYYDDRSKKWEKRYDIQQPAATNPNSIEARRAAMIKSYGGPEKYSQLFPDDVPGGRAVNLSVQPGHFTLSPGIHERVDREIAALNAPAPNTRLVEAPDGSGVLGTQLSSRGASYDDVRAMWDATGALQYARPYNSNALPGTLAGERQLNPYDIEERVVLQEDPTAVYRELYPDETIYDYQQPSAYDTYEEGKLSEDPVAAYRKEFPNRKVVNAGELKPKKGDKKQSKEPSGRNWMKPRSMGDKTYGELRREILLGESSGPEAMRQLDALRGYVKSGSDRYKIPKNYKKGMQLGPKLTDEEYQDILAKERSQEFLNKTLSELKQTASESQNPVVSNESTAEKMTPGQRKMFPLGKGVTFGDTDNESVQMVKDFDLNNKNAWDFEKETEGLNGYAKNYMNKSYF